MGGASATIIGVPSEGLLVPLGLHGLNEDSGVAAFTGVLIETPALVGVDTIINDYTAPNTTKGGYAPPESKGLWNGGMTVHYYMFDEKSNHVYDSTFVMSPDDVYFWLPPSSVFNYGQGGKNWTGYVVFADEAARKGDPATFVMTGQAGIALAANESDDIVDVPVVPLSDGDDAGGIRIGNEITYSPQQLPRIEDVVPLVAGTRYYGAPGTTTTIVTGLIPVYKNIWGTYAIWHMMWFSENGMHADIDFCDDEELCVSCTDWTFNEVNALVYLFGEDGASFLDGVKTFKDAMAFECEDGGDGDGDCEFEPGPYHSACGVYGGASMYKVLDEGHYPGIGMALYEFGSKSGVAGVNFQVSTSQLWGDSQQTDAMTTNGQF